LPKLQVGQLVVSCQGRDAGRFYLVIEILDDGFVKVSDGSKRPLSKPKIKNIRHLRRFNDKASNKVAQKLTLKRASDREVIKELNDLTKQIGS